MKKKYTEEKIRDLRVTLPTRLVIAGHHRQFQRWLEDDEFYGINAVEVRNTGDIVGRKREKVEVIKIGSWYENQEAIDSVERWLGHRI